MQYRQTGHKVAKQELGSSWEYCTGIKQTSYAYAAPRSDKPLEPESSPLCIKVDYGSSSLFPVPNTSNDQVGRSRCLSERVKTIAVSDNLLGKKETINNGQNRQTTNKSCIQASRMPSVKLRRNAHGSLLFSQKHSSSHKKSLHFSPYQKSL